MSGWVLIVAGIVLGIAGVRSLRWAFFAAGFGAGWLVSAVFGVSTGSALLWAIGGALVALVLAVVAARVAFLIVGALIGALVGSRLLQIVEGGDASIALAVLFIPAAAVVGAVIAARWRQGVLGWATAIGGSALVLAGLAVLAPTTLGWLRNPTTAAGSVLAFAIWIALAVGARIAQKRLSGQSRPPVAPA
jgi:hypothetical protein